MVKPKNLGTLLAADDDGPEENLSAQKVNGFGEKLVRIVLEENDNIPPTGQFFGLNGRTWMLRPGDEADVPMGLISILNDAVQAVPQIDQATKQVIGYRNKLRFPYRVVQPQAA